MESLNDWVVELSDPNVILRHHRDKGRDVRSLTDLRRLDLEELEELTTGSARRWRTVGVVQGASFGALAMLPAPVVSSAAAIGLDMIAMQAMTDTLMCVMVQVSCQPSQHSISRHVSTADQWI